MKDRVGSQNMRIYLPHVEYRYDVNGESFTGRTITDGSDRWYTGDPAHALARIGEYPVGASVTVYYDPRRPQDSCLERARGAVGIAYLIPLAMLVGGLAVAWMVLAPIIARAS